MFEIAEHTVLVLLLIAMGVVSLEDKLADEFTSDEFIISTS